MGKFTFPLPGRKQKPAPAPPPPPVGPLSKAQKVLGTAQISVDSPSTLSPSSKWGWDTRSNSGISIAVSGSTASHTDAGEMGLGILHEGEVANPSPRRELRWEDESEILPRCYNRQSTMADTTDAASLRRRQSSSTIASFYDKSKQPLSISQQTSNSAMAKGVPSKVHAMLDMDGTLSGVKDKKKKPARLDLSSLIPKSLSHRHLRPDVDRSHVLGPDMMTKSPSVMSMSPDMTPSPSKHRTDLFPRRKKTKESLREVQPSADSRQHVGRPSTSPNLHRPTKSTVTQLNLYNHYEQRFFAEVMGQETTGAEGHESPSPGRIPGKDAVPPLPSHPSRMQNPAKQQADISMNAALTPMSLVSPPTDSCSISSRHTRTSKASKKTDRSLTDLDLQKQSVLSLSSDSEDDGYEASYNGSLTVPPTSDGQASPTSPRSAMSQRSGANAPQDQGKGKSVKRTSFATTPQFLPIPEGSSSSNTTKFNPRLSSLNPNFSGKQSLSASRQDLRMSIASTSTSKTLVFGVSAHDHPQGPKIISMMRKNSAPTHPSWLPGADNNELEGFPTPPGARAHRPSLASVTSDHPTPPLSPTSVDFYLQSHHTSFAALDNGSIKSDKSGNKVDGRRRGSSTSSVNDSGSGRFMAVTRQEEMLLAALRMKRARMREDIIAEFEEDLDRNEHGIDRHVTNDSSASSSRISRQSSASTMRTGTHETGALSMRPQHHQQPQIRISAGSTKKKTEPNHIAASADRARSGSKSRSRSSSNSRSSSALGIRSANTIISPTARTVPTHRAMMSEIPSQILEEEPLEEEEEEEEEQEDDGVPRPDSPISPSAFPVPMAMTRKKQVRLSAVGNNQINIEAGWWNDSG
ncbi:hypothetical protein QBC37DRAFT_290111 [Rhypophila decipiens]|uniref:Uncharacterized protein n=1 Tax=Rhypophila decipiens TaxID=261697 RepID=A0AAN7B5Y9_9PEZI|nr:hypothetical protein QBC37DRAFT_290111 [Rhypophila decipiens]